MNGIRACLMLAAALVAGLALPASGQERPVWVGTGSCAAASCHKGRVDPTRPGGQEYEYWATHDPHARAFAVLYDPRSLRIEANYRRLNDRDSARPFADDLCLRCHVHQDFRSLDPAGRPVEFAREDGVGCESCHGPARNWIVPHVEVGWRGLTAGQKQESFGLRATKDLRVRAEVCAECHVGVGTTEVNHDLVAAGHPRLTFDYAGQLAKLPKHWRVGDDRARNPGYDAKAWALGRVVGAEASLRLLADRARRAAPEDSKTPWPELSEYGCFSCHQGVRPDAGGNVSGSLARTGSALPWATWALAPSFDAALLAGGEPGLAGGDPLGALRTLMAEGEPDPARVERSARQAADLLSARADRINRSPVSVQSVRDALSDLVAPPGAAGVADWDAAAQSYLATVALRATLVEYDARYRDPALKAGINALYSELNLPARTPQGLLDSPAGFDPARVRRNLSLIRDALPPPTLGSAR